MKIERRTVPVALGFCILNWLVPGSGFLVAGDRKRGIALMLILNGIFAVGLLYSGYLTLPAFSPRNPNFNIVSLLTFIVQACHGGGTVLLVLARNVLGGPAFLVRDMGGAYADLGGFHFLVAGGLNYFTTVRLYDLLAGDPDADSSPKPNTDPAKSPQTKPEGAES